MLKKGFTLQELLITVGIVGIISAALVPAIVRMIPNHNKMMYLKAYNVLAKNVSEIINDDSLYYNDNNCTGLDCVAIPTVNDRGIPQSLESYIGNSIEQYTKNSGSFDNAAQKFAVLFSYNLNRSEDLTSEDGAYKFMTTDGIEWEIKMVQNSNNLKIIIDVDPKKEGGFVTDNVKDPDKFSFTLSNIGTLSPSDKLGKIYLKNPSDMHSKQEEINEATKETVQPLNEASDHLININNQAIKPINN